MKVEYIYPGDEIDDARRVRTTVFVNEQRFDAENEFDSTDRIAHHGVIYSDEGTPVATGRIFPNKERENQYIVGRVAVLKEYRGTGVGAALMNALENLGIKLGATSLYLGAQDHAVSFYEKCGYKVVGEMYMDEHTPHLPMEKTLRP